MRVLPVTFGVVAIALVGAMIGAGGPEASPEMPTAFVARERAGREAILPLPYLEDLPDAKVALGRKLFFEPRLSRDDSISCASCHDPRRGGADGRRYPIGIGGAVGAVNTPTVFNAALNAFQFWDARAATLEEQAAGPVHNPIEMGSNWNEVIGKLAADPAYARAFAGVYPDGMTAASIADAIATYERTLLTTGSRFDRYLRGDPTALTARELSGFRRFMDFGCASCHQGANIGGNMLQRFGVMSDRIEGRATTGAAPGRYAVTGREEDRSVFKVPSLREVTNTAPYFHDGSVASLSEAVAIMARVQLGREISADDTEAIVAFLGTLVGSLPQGALP